MQESPSRKSAATFVRLALVAAVLGPGVVRGQDTPAGVPVRVTAGADGIQNAASQLSVTADVLPSPDLPTGYLSLADANSWGGPLSPHPENPADSEKYYARMEPGKAYDFTISGSYLFEDLAWIAFDCPPEYQIELDGVMVNAATDVIPTFTSVVHRVRVIKRGARPSARAGTASSFSNGELFWEVALGTLSNGQPGGSLALIDGGKSASWASLFTPAGLQFEDTTAEISSYRESGAIRQVLANEACVDVITLSSTSYELRFYHFSQMLPSSNPRTFKGFPFVTYRVEQELIAPGNNPTRIKITSETRTLNGVFTTDAPASTTVIGELDSNAPIARTADTVLERTGDTFPAFTWTLSDWNTVGQTRLREEYRVWGGTMSARTESIDVRIPSGASAINAGRNFSLQNWGEVIANETLGTTGAVTATYEPYADKTQVGSYSNVRSTSVSGGGWEAFEYDTYAVGLVTRRHRPFQGSPTSVPSNLAANTLGEVTSYSWVAGISGQPARPDVIETKVNNVTVSKADFDYVDSIVFAEILGVTQVTRNDSIDAVNSLTTITKYFREDNGDDLYRGQLHSVRSPDGTKKSFVYQRGEFSGGIFDTNGSALGSGPDTRIVVITGSATTGDTCPAVDGYTVDEIYLVANKSTKQTVIRDSLAHVVRTETEVWTGTAWTSVSWVTSSSTDYDFANQLTASVSSNGGQYSAAFTGELKQWEQDATGVKLSYVYDHAGRVDTVTKEGVGAIAALATKFTYNAANRVTQRTIGTSPSETIGSSQSYDLANRISSETEPRPGGSITTQYSYNPGSRQVTVTLPNGGTRIETRRLEGTLESVTGTGVVEEYYSATIESGGIRKARLALTSSGSTRIREEYTDWLGRPTQSSVPGFTGLFPFVTSHSYESGTGRLKKVTRTSNSAPMYAPTLYEYDTLSQVVRSGLDIAASDTLVLSSTDRVNDQEQFFENYNGAWWLTTVSKTYPTAASSTPLTVSTERRRLTGFTGSVQEEAVTTDVDGVVTTRTSSVNPSTKTVTISTTTTGFANTATETRVNGLTISVTGFDGLTYGTGYDSLHRVSTRTDPRTGSRTTVYHSGTPLVWKVQDAVSPTPNVVATYGYDSAGRVNSVTDAQGRVTYTEYNTRDQIVHRWGHGTHPVEYGYNSFGECISMKTYRGGSGWTGSTWPTGTTGTADTTTWTFDTPSGLLTTKTYPAAATGTGDPALDEPQSVTYTYNARGQTATRTWARGTVTTYDYNNSTGELLTQTYSDGTPGVTYTYTRSGQVDSVDDTITGARDFVYNSSQPLRLDGLGLSSFYDSRVLTRLYDSIKRPTGFTLGAGAIHSSTLTQTHTYNSLGRFDNVASVSSVQASRTFSYSYNTGGLVSGLGVVSSPFSVTREYELKRDLLTLIEAKWNTTSRTRYDYAYNTLAQRESAKQSGDVFGDFGGSTYHRYAYNERGEMVDATAYQGEDPGSTSSPQLSGRHHAYTYDTIGNRLTASRTGTAGAPDDFVTYATNQYKTRENNVGFIAGTVVTGSVAGVTGGSPAPVVGQQGRYWSAQVMFNNTSGPVKGTATITATLAGAGSGGVDLVRTENRDVYLAKALQTFTYDKDGNMTTDGVWNYAYDGENRLKQMTTTSLAVTAGFPNRTLEFKYDYLGRRVQKRSLNSTAGTDVYRRYLYDGWDLIAEFDAPSGTSCGNIVKSYTWGLDMAGSLSATGGVGGLVQITDHTGTPASYFPTYDGNGNVASLLRASDGVVVAKYEYSPFGELLRAEGTYAASNPFRFSTKFTDDESGLVYYGARFYSPSLGRFINRDPIEEQGGLNLYGFCGNDGVNGYDYLGYSWLSKLWKKVRHAVVKTVLAVVGYYIGGPELSRTLVNLYDAGRAVRDVTRSRSPISSSTGLPQSPLIMYHTAPDEYASRGRDGISRWIHFGIGALQALIHDLNPNPFAIEPEPLDGDHRDGMMVGHAAAILIGAGEMHGGGAVAAVGVTAAVGTKGALAPGAAVAVAGGGALAAHGAGTSYKGLSNLIRMKMEGSARSGNPERPVWTSHGGKHVASSNEPWKKTLESTKSGPAKYKPGTDVESLERKVWAEGSPAKNGRPWKVMEFPEDVGASGGKGSRWVRVEESGGTIHGHPITHEEYLKHSQ